MTKIYGASDDLIEFEGDVSGEVGCYGTDDGKGVMVICSDGTILEVKYGKMDLGIWGIVAHKKGDLFDRIESCEDEDAQPHSDVVFFKTGLKSAYAATQWERVK